MIEKEFSTECCVRGHHVYQSKWEANVGSELTVCKETRPGALVEDKYAMALKYGDVTVGHVPKFLSKITYFYMKSGGEVSVRITGKRQHTKDLPQGGMELPAMYTFKSTNVEVHTKLPDVVSVAIKDYNECKKVALSTSKQAKKKKLKSL